MGSGDSCTGECIIFVIWFKGQSNSLKSWRFVKYWYGTSFVATGPFRGSKILSIRTNRSKARPQNALGSFMFIAHNETLQSKSKRVANHSTCLIWTESILLTTQRSGNNHWTAGKPRRSKMYSQKKRPMFPFSIETATSTSHDPLVLWCKGPQWGLLWPRLLPSTWYTSQDKHHERKRREATAGLRWFTELVEIGVNF